MNLDWDDLAADWFEADDVSNAVAANREKRFFLRQNDKERVCPSRRVRV